MEVIKPYRYRIYPNAEQREYLKRAFDAKRYFYNDSLEYSIEYRKEHHKYPKYGELSRRLTERKKDETPAKVIQGVSSVVIQQGLRDLKHALESSGTPKFKSRKEEQSIRLTRYGFNWCGETQSFTLALLTHSRFRIKRQRTLTEEPSSLTITLNRAGQYHAVFLARTNIEPLPETDSKIGIDVGISSYYTDSNGVKVENPKHYERAQRRLARLQRRHARTQKGSANREKLRLKIAKQHLKIANQRKDFLHKLSTKLIRENQVVSVERLRIKKMQQHRYLARSIASCSWFEFRRMLKYKAEWYGRSFTTVPHHYPSSKLCSSCGHKLKELSLDVREWKCPSCGTLHDRDHNAAKNILAKGLKDLEYTAALAARAA